MLTNHQRSSCRTLQGCLGRPSKPYLPSCKTSPSKFLLSRPYLIIQRRQSNSPSMTQVCCRNGIKTNEQPRTKSPSTFSGLHHQDQATQNHHIPEFVCINNIITFYSILLGPGQAKTHSPSSPLPPWVGSCFSRPLPALVVCCTAIPTGG